MADLLFCQKQLLNAAGKLLKFGKILNSFPTKFSIESPSFLANNPLFDTLNMEHMFHESVFQNYPEWKHISKSSTPPPRFVSFSIESTSTYNRNVDVNTGSIDSQYVG